MSDTTVEQATPARRKTIEIQVNKRQVEVDDRRMTGLEIKQAAIAQDVPIRLDFLLSHHRPNGDVEIIGDTDEVQVRQGAKFTAVAGDDNS